MIDITTLRLLQILLAAWFAQREADAVNYLLAENRTLRARFANAHAERFVRSIKEECLDRVVLLGEHHFRTTMREFVAHYHHERPHQGCGNVVLQPRRSGNGRGHVRRHRRLGGLLNSYERAE